MSAVFALVICELLLLSLSPPAVASPGADGSLPRRSLHQPFFPMGWSPPPPASGDVAVPPPPAAAAAATTSPARSTPSVTNIVAIALTAGLVALAVVSYSCVLLWRRVAEGAEDDRAAAKPAGALAARIPSDAGSSARHQTSPPPSSTVSDAIYLDPLTAVMEVRHHRSSPDLRPLQLQKQPSPDLRPLPPLKRLGTQPPPPPAATPPMTGTEYSSSDEDHATFYTALKTNMSSFSRSTSQRSTMEHAVPPPVAPPPASVPVPPPPAPAPAAPPPQANRLRPPRPPPLPRQRLLRPMPAESPPPAALANLSLTSPPEASVQDREAGSSAVQPDGSTRPPSLKPLHWDKLRAISGRTTVWDQVKNSDSFRYAPLPFLFPQYLGDLIVFSPRCCWQSCGDIYSVDEAAMENLFPQNSAAAAAAGNSGQAARGGKQHGRLLDPKRLQNVAIILKALNVTADEVIGALVHGEFAHSYYHFPFVQVPYHNCPCGACNSVLCSLLVQFRRPHVMTVHEYNLVIAEPSTFSNLAND